MAVKKGLYRSKRAANPWKCPKCGNGETEVIKIPAEDPETNIIDAVMECVEESNECAEEHCTDVDTDLIDTSCLE